jgi:hypothetical protein
MPIKRYTLHKLRPCMNASLFAWHLHARVMAVNWNAVNDKSADKVVLIMYVASVVPWLLPQDSKSHYNMMSPSL